MSTHPPGLWDTVLQPYWSSCSSRSESSGFIPVFFICVVPFPGKVFPSPLYLLVFLHILEVSAENHLLQEASCWILRLDQTFLLQIYKIPCTPLSGYP